MDANEGNKYNQKFVMEGSQVLYEIISGREIDYGGWRWAFY